MLCLGDIVGYGPDPKHCLDAVRASVTHLICGWHDRAAGNSGLTQAAYTGPDQDGYELAEATLTHTRLMLSAEDRTYLASLPPELTVEIANVRFHLTRLPPDDLTTETRTLITMPQAQLRESGR